MLGETYAVLNAKSELELSLADILKKRTKGNSRASWNP
jgi:hypothetical protein